MAKGQFEKGNLPHNKGKKLQDYLPQETIAKIKSSQFVEGIHTGEGSASWKGGLQQPKSDCTHIWSGTNQRTRRPKFVYEKAHGELPKNWVIYHLDQDKDNDELENLIAIPRSILIRLNNGRMGNSYREIVQELEKILTKK